MAVIQVSEAQPGMVLSAEVRDNRGRLLVTSGRELTRDYLVALRAWGITHVQIEDEDDPTQLKGPIQEWAMHQATEELEERLKRVDRSHPAMSQIVAVCHRSRAHRIQSDALAAEERS